MKTNKKAPKTKTAKTAKTTKTTKIAKTPKVVLIRTHSAGVHVGELVSFDPHAQHAVLNRSHRVWRWRGANTLSALALGGASTTEFTCIEAGPDGLELTGVIEVLPCSAVAATNLMTPRWLDVSNVVSNVNQESLDHEEYSPGSGDGEGHGDGDGDGSGSGDAFGKGDGDGHGAGHGSGDGDRHGDANGSEHGDGDGYGSGDGDGGTSPIKPRH